VNSSVAGGSTFNVVGVAFVAIGISFIVRARRGGPVR